MQPTHIQQAELNAANLAAHVQSAATAAQAASGPATPRAARGNIHAAATGAEPTDPFASMEQTSDPGDNLTEISDATELQQQTEQHLRSNLVRVEQESQQKSTLIAQANAERDQEHKLRQAAEQGKAAEAAARVEAEQRLAAERAQFEQALAAARAERDARPTVAQLQAMIAERDARPTAIQLQAMTAERDGRPTTTQLQAITAALNARPTLDSLTKVTRDLAAKAAELNVQRARMEAAELRAKQIVAALPPELQAIADKPAALQEAIVWRDISLEMLSIYHVTWLRTDVSLIKKVGWENVPAYRNLRIQGKAARQSLGII